jgi:hypothetical protein
MDYSKSKTKKYFDVQEPTMLSFGSVLCRSEIP